MEELPLEEQLTNWCRYFVGIQEESCELGIPYDTVRDPMRGLPCIKRNNCAECCAVASFPSKQEIVAQAQQIKAVLDSWRVEAGKSDETSA